MVPKANSCTIVVIGFWNRMIFTPQWVAQNIYGQEEIESLISLVPIAPVTYRDDRVEMRVSNTRLEFIVRAHRDDCMTRAQDLACRTLERLSVTPVSAAGINFGFSQSQPDEALLRLFNFADDGELAGHDWQILIRPSYR